MGHLSAEGRTHPRALHLPSHQVRREGQYPLSVSTRPCPPPAYSAPGTHHHPSFNICYPTDNPGGSSIIYARNHIRAFCRAMSGLYHVFFLSLSLIRTEVCMEDTKTQSKQERFAPPARSRRACRPRTAEEAFQTPQKRDVGRRFLSNGPLPSPAVRRSPRAAALASSVINRLQLAFLVDPVVRVHSSVGWPAFRGRGREGERERDSFIVSAALICVLPRSPPLLLWLSPRRPSSHSTSAMGRDRVECE